MKKLFATALLSLAVSPVFADGIHETVSASRITDTNAVSSPVETAYSPVYRQVTGNWMRGIDGKQFRVNTMTRFSYSPLYRKVTGKMS